MKYLAIDTSGKYLTVIASGDKKAVRFLPDCALSHSVVLMGEVENALNKAGMKAEDADVFACSVGAGSFTGIRIGVSTVKAFAYALSKRVLGVTTFEVLAYSVSKRVKKLALVSARHGNYYVCGFDEDGKVILPPKFMTVAEINEIKDGYTLIADEDPDNLGAIVADMKVGFERAVEDNLDRATDDAETLVPLYVKKSQAEEEA